jgi:hypothetical protein
MSGAVPLRPPYDFVTCTGANFYLLHLLCYQNILEPFRKVICLSHVFSSDLCVTTDFCISLLFESHNAGLMWV